MIVEIRQKFLQLPKQHSTLLNLSSFYDKCSHTKQMLLVVSIHTFYSAIIGILFCAYNNWIMHLCYKY